MEQAKTRESQFHPYKNTFKRCTQEDKIRIRLVIEDELTPVVSPILMTNGISLASWMQSKQPFIGFPVGNFKDLWIQLSM